MEELLEADAFQPELHGDAERGLDVLPRADLAPPEDIGASSDEEEVGRDPAEALLEESWKNRPAEERELWERVRPRALRREAARLKQLKLPGTTISRLMKLHPDLCSKTSEALETINCATVLLLQHVAQAAVRGRKSAGQRVKLDDLKQVCLNSRELNFLLPLGATLDASTLAMSRHAPNDNATSKAAANAQELSAGQSTLSTAAFTRNVSHVDGEEGDEDLDVVTVQGNLEAPAKTPQEKKGSKRKLPPSTKKASSKAARQEKVASPVKPAGAAGLANFFKKSEVS